MSNAIVGVIPCPSNASTDQGQGAPPPPAAVPHRRPRVREVSSRFMSPTTASSSSSAGDLHSMSAKSPLLSISKSKHPPLDRERSSKPTPQRRLLLPPRQEQGPLSCCAHENIPETVRSLDTPFPLALGSQSQRSGTTKAITFSTNRKQRAVKVLKENGHGGETIDALKSFSSSRTGKCSRPDTPTATGYPTTDRIVLSRFRLPQRQTNSSPATDAANLLHSTGLSLHSSRDAFSIPPPLEPCSDSDRHTLTTVAQNLVESQTPSSDIIDSIQGSSSFPNSPTASTTSLPLADTRISMPEGDVLATRLLVRSSSCSSSSYQSSSKLSTPSLCSRSLNLPLSSCQHYFKSNERPSSTLCKPYTTDSSLSMENHTLPPQPTSMRPGIDSRKGRKLLTSIEETHSLKLLHNHHLLWRYANAKAQVSMHAQSMEIESQFFSLAADMLQRRDAVKRKHIELALLQRTKSLSTILEAHMPCLDEWSALEEDFTDSLSGVRNALVNSLLRLPVSGNVQVNIKEAAEALDSAAKTMEMIIANVQSFIPKGEEMDSLISELATVINGEISVMEECGNLLSQTHSSQVEECSLRGHLMQVHCSNHN